MPGHVYGSFLVHGACDTDADGEPARYLAKDGEEIQRLTPPEVY